MKRHEKIWIDANIATMAENGESYGSIKNAAIAVSGGKISWLGIVEELPAFPEQMAEEVISLKGKWITPGLVDCHTHIVFGGNRADEFEKRLKGVSYEEIAKAGGGINSTVTATRKASEKELFLSAEKRIKKLMAEGVTTIEIKSGYGLDYDNEIKMLQVIKELKEKLSVDISATYLGAHALPSEYKEDRSGYVDMVCEKVMPAIAEKNLADAVDVFCEGIGFSVDETKRVLQKAVSLGFKTKVHADQLSDLSGSGIAAEYNALSADHMEYVSEESIAKMAKSGTVAVLLPAAFYILREKQLPPVDLLRKYNVPMAFSTDCNPGSSPCLSLLAVMNMACTLFKVTPEEALKGVTVNAAKALGIGDEKGTLEIGKTADFVIWDIETPAELSYWLSNNQCCGVVKSGKG